MRKTRKDNFISLGKSKRRRQRVQVSQNGQLTSSNFEALFNDLPGEWEEKARKLQIRRWRRIKHQLT